MLLLIPLALAFYSDISGIARDYLNKLFPPAKGYSITSLDCEKWDNDRDAKLGCTAVVTNSAGGFSPVIVKCNYVTSSCWLDK